MFLSGYCIQYITFFLRHTEYKLHILHIVDIYHYINDQYQSYSQTKTQIQNQVTEPLDVEVPAGGGAVDTAGD